MSKRQHSSKALFIIPSFPARTYSGRTMGPDYVGSHLCNTRLIAGHDIAGWDILDLDLIKRGEAYQLLRKKLNEESFTFIGISYLSFQADEAMEIASICSGELDRVGRRSRKGEAVQFYAPIICGGRGVADAENYAHLYGEVDIFVTGKLFHQPLDTIVSIARLIKARRVLDFDALGKVPGIVSRDPENGRLISTPANKHPEHPIDFYFENLTRKSHNEKYDFDIFQDEVAHRARKTAQVYTQLGCDHYCSFCFESMRPQPKYERSIESFSIEAERLIKEGYEAIYFDDSTFTQNRKRAAAIIELMGRLNRDHGVVWAFNTRIDALDEELIDSAVKNGCMYNFEGVETLVPEVVEGMGKLCGRSNPAFPAVSNGSEYVERTKAIFKIMRERGLVSAVFLIFGAPKRLKDGRIAAATLEDDKRSIRESIWELRPRYLAFNIMRFIPDAAISIISRYRDYRGGDDFGGGFYYRRWREEHQRHILTADHPIYHAFESAGDRYPMPPQMTPDVCYHLLKYMVDEVNEYRRRTGEAIIIRTDDDFSRKYLPMDSDGYYNLAAFEDLEKERTI